MRPRTSTVRLTSHCIASGGSFVGSAFDSASDNLTDVFMFAWVLVATVVRVDRSFSVTLQQARTQKGLTQKDLATKICEKPSVIADYESGRAIPNPQVRHEHLRRLEPFSSFS